MRLDKAYIALGETLPALIRKDEVPENLDNYVVDCRADLASMKKWLADQYLSSAEDQTEVIIYEMTPIAVLRLPVKTEELSVQEFLDEIKAEKPQ